jgi:hypothetical protein
MKNIQKVSAKEAVDKIKNIIKQSELSNFYIAVDSIESGEGKFPGLTAIGGDFNAIALHFAQDIQGNPQLLPVFDAAVKHGSGDCACHDHQSSNGKSHSPDNCPVVWKAKKVQDFLISEGAKAFMVCMTRDDGDGFVIKGGEPIDIIKQFASAIRKDEKNVIIPLFATSIEAGTDGQCKLVFAERTEG